MSTLRTVHRELLERWRRSMNLVGPGPLDVHFVDCDLAIEGLQPRGRWADLGSGAGFPGLVLADRCSDLAVDLVDSRRKRCVFLEEVVARAGVEDRVRVLHTRVESLPDAGWDGVTARAFAPPDRVLAHAARLLRPGGELFLLHGDGVTLGGPAWERLAHRSYVVSGSTHAVTHLRLRS